MKKNSALVASILIVIGYLVFALLAFVNFPGEFSPFQNWLSDLGSQLLNPQGARFYNLGIVLTGILLFVFYLGLSQWRMAENKTQNIMLLLTQIFGFLGAFAMAMSAVFPITIEAAHSSWSTALYILLGTSFGFSVAAFRYHAGYPKWLLVLGAIVAIEDMIWGMLLNTYWMEWLTVFLMLGYCLLVGLETRRQPKAYLVAQER